MRIVINAFSARLGGGQTYLKNLLARLPDNPDLAILIFAPEDLVLPQDPRLLRGTTNMPVSNPILRLIWERLVLPGELIKFDADVLFCPGGLINTRAPNSCRTVTMFRNMLPFDDLALSRLPWGLQKIRNKLLRGQMLRSMSEADLTIFISNFARAEIERRTKLKSAATIPHGVNETFLTVGKDIPRPEQVGDRPYVLYVSRFEAYKHHYEVVQAFAKLPQALRERYRLLLVGEDNFEQAERVASYIKANGLQNAIAMLGAVPYEELPAFYRNAAAILFASSCENCPNILLESLGAGRPVLSSNVDPMPEFGGLDLQYFSPYDADDISQKLEQVLSEEALAGRIAEAAAKRALKYDWKNTAEATWSAIFEIAKARN